MIQTQIIRPVIDPAAVAAALGGPATRPPGIVTQPISRITKPQSAAVPTPAPAAATPPPPKPKK